MHPYTVGALEPSLGFTGATLVCIAVCFVTKLGACAMQQKLIGEKLSGSVAVRYAVGINSLQMRAIRYCLEQPGLNPAKVCILCGGPDWPTSVLCGKAVQVDIRVDIPWVESTLGCQPVESTSLFKVVVSDVNLQPYIVRRGDGPVQSFSVREVELAELKVWRCRLNTSG